MIERAYREWSSIQDRTSRSAPLASWTWVMSVCQHSLGRSAWNRLSDDLGRLRGLGVINPATMRCRRIVDVDTLRWWWCSRCHPIVAGPASSPSLVRVRRNKIINAITSSGTRAGDVLGRRDLGSNAASPSVRYRATQRDTVASETANSRATTAWDRPSRTPDKMTNRRFDIRPHQPKPTCTCPEQHAPNTLHMS